MLKKSIKEVSQALITTNGQKSTEKCESLVWIFSTIKTRQFASNVATTLTFVENNNFTTTDVQLVKTRIQANVFMLIAMGNLGNANIQRWMQTMQRECKHTKVDNTFPFNVKLLVKFNTNTKAV